MEPKDLPFDFNEAKALARDYSNATGMECLVLREDDQTIFNPCPGKIHKELCFEKSSEIAKWCAMTHRRSAANAQNQQKCISYFCPMGLLHWTAPITVNGQICGAFVAGHAFLNKARENILALNSRSSKYDEILENYPDLKKSLLASPVIDDEKLFSLKRILVMMADSLSDDTRSNQALRLEELLQGDHKEIAEEQHKNKLWKSFIEHLHTGNPVEIEKGLRRVIQELRSGNHDITEFKSRLTNIILTIYQDQKQGEAPNYLTDVCLNALNEMEHISDEENLADWASKNIRALLEDAEYLPSIKNADVIYSAIEYIDSHYQEHISLQDIADHVHFSPPYFSKIFKKEMNITFTQYLTKVRIEESKKFLKDTSIALSDIPSMVGFEEQSYFTKVFHSVVGTSPGKYREQQNY
ncbi:MAG: AraC family transcriptional regulator [Bacillota bacterium]|nr:AraC family transcriptional regulator [Bacillota bacterium]